MPKDLLFSIDFWFFSHFVFKFVQHKLQQGWWAWEMHTTCRGDLKSEAFESQDFRVEITCQENKTKENMTLPPFKHESFVESIFWGDR